MEANTKKNGWSMKAIAAAERIARREGTTVEQIQKEEVRRHRLFSGRGALYRADIIGPSGN